MALQQDIETTTPLAANAEAIGTSRDCLNFSHFNVSAAAAKAGARGKCSIAVENSTNGSDWLPVDDEILRVPPDATATFNRSYPVTRRYYRSRVKNLADHALDTTELVSVRIP